MSCVKSLKLFGSVWTLSKMFAKCLWWRTRVMLHLSSNLYKLCIYSRLFFFKLKLLLCLTVGTRKGPLEWIQRATSQEIHQSCPTKLDFLVGPLLRIWRRAPQFRSFLHWDALWSACRTSSSSGREIQEATCSVQRHLSEYPAPG